jgi:hypothetical protein
MKAQGKAPAAPAAKAPPWVWEMREFKALKGNAVKHLLDAKTGVSRI